MSPYGPRLHFSPFSQTLDWCPESRSVLAPLLPCGRAHRRAAAADGGCARPNVTARDPGCESFKPIMRCRCVDGGKAIQLSNFMADVKL